MPARIALILLLLYAPARAFPWLLARDHGRLTLLSPCDVHEYVQDLYPWQFGSVSFSCQQEGDALRLELYGSVRHTNWYVRWTMIQHADGRVFVVWEIEDAEPCRMTFARFQSFDAAWRDVRVRQSLLPLLRHFGQTLPTFDELHEAFHPTTRPADLRPILARLSDADPQVCARAKRELSKYPPSVLHSARSLQLSPGERVAVGGIEERERERVRLGVELVEMLLWWGF